MSVRQAIKSDGARRLTISGPADLLDRIGDALMKEEITMTRIVRDDVDLRVELSVTAVETCLAAWARNLSDKERD